MWLMLNPLSKAGRARTGSPSADTSTTGLNECLSPESVFRFVEGHSKSKHNRVGGVPILTTQ